jgi:hypothetical protein
VRNRLLLGLTGFTLLVAALLAVVLKDWLRETVAPALLYTLWVGYLVFRSIPQSALWATFLALALLVALGSLRRGKKALPKLEEIQGDHPGRVQALTAWIGKTAQGDYFRWRFARYLEDLSVQVLAHRERLTPEQVRDRLGAAALGVPPEIRAYLLAGRKQMAPMPGPILLRLSRLLRPGGQTSPLHLDTERVVQFLEDQLEISYDRQCG